MRDMTCSVHEDYLQMYLDGRLEALERMVLAEHLRTCRGCLKALNQLKVLDWDLKSLPEPQLPRELEALRGRVVAEYARAGEGAGAEEKRGPAAAFLQNQYSHLSRSIRFTGYLPGRRLIHKYTATGYKMAARTGRKQVIHLLRKMMGI